MKYLDTSLADVNFPRPSPSPKPGWHVISVNKIYDHDTTYHYFQEFEPVGMVGYSMNIYHLTEEDVRQWSGKQGGSGPLPRRSSTVCRKIPTGTTLVEILVAISIIGVLMALMLPAVQAAREAARKVSCKNNLRQIGMVLQSHHAAYNRFPSNGWGFRWMGDPAGGPNAEQPGGWIYSLLPYLEQESLHRLGRGISGLEKEAQLTQVMHTPVRCCMPQPASGQALSLPR
jgi:hypothetical protein